MNPDTDVCQTEQPQISYSVDFIAEQSSAMGSPILLDREGKIFSLKSVYRAIWRLTTTRVTVTSYKLQEVHPGCE